MAESSISSKAAKHGADIIHLKIIFHIKIEIVLIRFSGYYEGAKYSNEENTVAVCIENPGRIMIPNKHKNRKTLYLDKTNPFPCNQIYLITLL